MTKIYLSLLLLCFSISSFAQVTVNLAPSKDNTLYSESLDNSDGLGGYVYAGRINSGGLRRALLRFDLSGIPAGAIVSSVTLTMTMVKSRNATSYASPIHRLLQDWGEGTSNTGSGVTGGGAGTPAATNDATWTNRFHPSTAWTTAGGNFSPTVSATTNILGPGVYTWSGAQLTSDVQGWVNNSATNFGWVLRGNEATTGSAKKFSSKDVGIPSELPTLTVVYTAAVPVTLTFVKATESKSGVLVNWQTQTELNNSFFLVEHSIDGTNFSPLGKVDGAGTSNTVKNYSFNHQLAPQGVQYYRLAQTDINGRVTYSSIVQVTVKGKYQQIHISPNPVVDVINLRGIKLNDKTTFSVYNASGAVVLTGKLVSQQINVDRLPAGYYTLSLTEPSATFFGKFLKK